MSNEYPRISVRKIATQTTSRVPLRPTGSNVVDTFVEYEITLHASVTDRTTAKGSAGAILLVLQRAVESVKQLTTTPLEGGRSQ